MKVEVSSLIIISNVYILVTGSGIEGKYQTLFIFNLTTPESKLRDHGRQILIEIILFLFMDIEFESIFLCLRPIYHMTLLLFSG